MGRSIYSIRMQFLSAVLLCVFLVFGFLIPSPDATAQVEYRFERFDPPVVQPWYFDRVHGVAADRDGYFYLTDNRQRIFKLSFDGDIIFVYRKLGNGPGEFGGIDFRQMATDLDGNLYISDSTRIHKFSPAGKFLMEIPAPGDVMYGGVAPHAVAVDSAGNIVISELANNRLTEYDPSGHFVEEILPGQFSSPRGVTFDSENNLYVAGSGQGVVYKIRPDNTIEFQATGVSTPYSVAVDSQGFIYVTDTNQESSTRFDPGGTNPTVIESNSFRISQTCFGPGDVRYTAANVGIQRWKRELNGTETNTKKFDPIAAGGFKYGNPKGVAYWSNPPNDRVFVASQLGHRVFQYDTDLTDLGTLVDNWPGSSADGELNGPAGVAVGPSGNVFVVDAKNQRIQKFNTGGGYITKWGSFGNGPDPFEFDLQEDYQTAGIAVDGNGDVYVADYGNDALKIFETSNGVTYTHRATWPVNTPLDVAVDRVTGDVYVTTNANNIVVFKSDGTPDPTIGNGFSFGRLGAVAVGPAGSPVESYIFVADSYNYRIVVFDETKTLATTFGVRGDLGDEFNRPSGLAVDSAGSLYVSDTNHHRVQKFKLATLSNNAKAVIVAAGGPFPGNNLWDATQISANFAYLSLLQQGYHRDQIQYLTDNDSLQISGGESLDVDLPATNSDLQDTLINWAPSGGTQDVVVYLVDHGGPGQFRMSGTETLSAATLDGWLDTLENAIPGTLTVVYDACESGTFSSTLNTTANRRIVLTSTSPGESAYFLSQGGISFSAYFWMQVYNGAAIGDAFSTAFSGMQQAVGSQTPILSDPGGLAGTTFLGNGTIFVGDAPAIGSISPASNIDGVSSALLYANSVTDTDGVDRVWATIRPPDFVQGDSTNPIQELPTLDLLPVGGDRYEAIFGEFTTPGQYQIAIYARDVLRNTTSPQLTTVTVGNPLKKRAIIIGGPSLAAPNWFAYQNNLQRAYDALKLQGYEDGEIALRAPLSFNAGVDGLASLSNLGFLIAEWAELDGFNLLVYLVGDGSAGQFQIGPNETLDPVTLDGWLDTLQATLPGIVTVVLDFDGAGSFIPDLAPPANTERVVIASAESEQSARFLSGGDISFSSYFWTRVLNGANVRAAFKHAQLSMRFAGRGQQATWDDNANGIADEKGEGQLAITYAIGAGIQLAGDDPVIGTTIATPSTLSSGTTSSTIRVDNVTSTESIAQVLATITPPDALGDPVVVPLSSIGGGSYEALVSGFDDYGFYLASVVAIDIDGNTSLPSEVEVFQSDDTLGDIYEFDDAAGLATYLELDGPTQVHNIHILGDEDWVRFFADTNDIITLETFDLGAGADTHIEIHRSDGVGGTVVVDSAEDTSPIDPLGEVLLFRPSDWGLGSDFYWVRVRFSPTSSLTPKFGPDSYYSLRIFREVAPCIHQNNVVVLLEDSVSHTRITGADLQVRVQGQLCPTGGCATLTEDSEQPGRYTIGGLSTNSTYDIDITATDYAAKTVGVVGDCVAVIEEVVNLVATIPPTTPVIQVTTPDVNYPGSHHYGRIGVLSSDTASLMVKNVGVGTLAGTASVPAPFEIVGNANYSLGAGGQQSISVRFTPTDEMEEEASAQATFTGGGGTAVTLTGSSNVIWLDFEFGGPTQKGTESQPYSAFSQVITEVDPGGLVNIEPGVHEAPITLNTPMTLKAPNGITYIGTP